MNTLYKYFNKYIHVYVLRNNQNFNSTFLDEHSVLFLLKHYSVIIGRISNGVSHFSRALFVFSIQLAIHRSFSVVKFMGVAGRNAAGLRKEVRTYDSPAITVIFDGDFVDLAGVRGGGLGDVMFGNDVDPRLKLCSEYLVPLLCLRTNDVGIFITYLEFP